MFLYKLRGIKFMKDMIRVYIYGCDYQADVCWQISNTIKQTSVGKCQMLSSRRLLANLKYYEADDVNLGFELELKFKSNG